MNVRKFEVVGDTSIIQYSKDIIASNNGIRYINSLKSGFKFWFVVSAIEAGIIYFLSKKSGTPIVSIKIEPKVKKEEDTAD